MALFRLNNGVEVEVDPEVARTMVDEGWTVTNSGTVVRNYWDAEARRARQELLSYRVMGGKAPQGKVWVHADGEWTNFRRENLILAARGRHHARAFGAMSHDELAAAGRKGARVKREQSGRASDGRPNPLGFRGVHKSGPKYRAVATVNGKQKHLDSFPTPEEAARAYDAALVAQGLPPINFPD